MHGKTGLFWLAKSRWLGKLEETVKIIVVGEFRKTRHFRNVKLNEILEV
jgi:hypothetical protein